MLLALELPAFATKVLFTAVETNAPMNRIITLVVVPPSGEQLINTNINVQPNIIIKPSGTTNYPVVDVIPADYDVYVAGLKQVFRLSVFNTNTIIPFYLLLKDGLTTYNYTNPIPTLGSAVIYNLYSTNIFTTNFNSTFITTYIQYVTNLFATYVTNNTLITTNVTINFPGGVTNLNLTPKSLMWSDINDGVGGIGWSSTLQLDELDVTRAFLTNIFTFLTNTTLLATDANGKLKSGYPLAATNVTYIPSVNITFTTNADGSINISSSSSVSISILTNNIAYITNLYVSIAYITNLFVTTNFVNTSFVTNEFVNVAYITNLFVTTNFVNTSYITNLFSSTAYITNLYVSTAYITNLYASTNFSTNLYFLSGKGNTLVISNNLNLDYITASRLVSTDAAKNITNALTSARFTFTGNVLDIASGSIPNADLQNSSITISGTDNQVSVSGGGPVSLGGTATLSLPSPVITPGNLSAPQITNTSFAASGVVTNDANGKTYTTPTLQNALLANSSITIQGSAVALGGTTLAAGSAPFFDLSSSTNLIYRYTTNAVTALALTFGKTYTTNLSANIVITAINAQDIAAYETGVFYCTNSGGTDRTVTLPGSFGGPGLGVPPVITVTNKQSARIYFEHYGNQESNAWFIARF